MSRKKEGSRTDVYARITDRIVADLEKGVRPWVQPWSAGNTTGRITRPLRHNGEPYTGMNVLLLWSEGLARGFTSPIWMTFKQSIELGGHVRARLRVDLREARAPLEVTDEGGAELGIAIRDDEMIEIARADVAGLVVALGHPHDAADGFLHRDAIEGEVVDGDAGGKRKHSSLGSHGGRTLVIAKPVPGSSSCHRLRPVSRSKHAICPPTGWNAVAGCQRMFALPMLQEVVPTA